MTTDIDSNADDASTVASELVCDVVSVVDELLNVENRE